MRELSEALIYVRDTGYVPWADACERALTEQMLSEGYIEFESMFNRDHGLRHRRWFRHGRYFLTRLGRRHLFEASRKD